MPITESITSVQGQALDLLTQAQDAIVDAVKNLATRVEPIVPDASLPFSDKLPSPEEVIDLTFGLAEKVLKANRQFAEKLVKAAQPVLKTQTAAAPAAPKSTAKAASVKAA